MADKNGDGSVSFSEYVSMVLGVELQASHDHSFQPNIDELLKR